MASVAFKLGKTLPIPFLMAVFAGSAAAAAILVAPIGLIEMLVQASGLPGLVPAAAAPLGATARALSAIGAAAVAMIATAGGLFVVDRIARALPHRERPEPLIEEEIVPRRRILVSTEDIEPRRPIFAESDLGPSFDLPAAELVPDEISEEPYELVEPVVEEQVEMLDLSPIARAMWQVPPRLPNMAAGDEDVPVMDDTDQGEFAEFVPVEDELVEDAPVEVGRGDAVARQTDPVFVEPAAEIVDRDSLSLIELLNRLEAGLERRRRVADATPASETRPVARPASVSDMDEALRDALGTLQRMSAYSR